MNTEDSQLQTASVPLALETELRLAKMRRQLVGIYDQLDIACEEIDVCAEAANSLGQKNMEKVLRASVGYRLSAQRKALTGVIERLGGATNLSELDEVSQETALRSGVG